uniref:DUF4781 domain-containing protein n=1 Tax=Panagrolaimus sp. JU765 TaxID=591449 RepID=A0AC34QJ70_9BILA
MSVEFEGTIGRFNDFDWNDPKLQEWFKEAKKMQKNHYRDNNNTRYFEYEDTQLDAIQLRVCQSLFGLRLSAPNPDKKAVPKATPSSFLKTYSWKERRRAREYQVKIVKYGKASKGKILINLVFVSAAFPDGNGGFNASENPVFALGEYGNVYLDAGGRVYESWEDYLTANKLPQGVMLYPKDGNYTPKTGTVVGLNARETPACKPSAKAKAVLDQAVMYGGIVLTGAAIVTMAPIGIFSAATLATISAGSFYIGTAMAAYSITTGLYEKLPYDESVMTEMIMIATTAFSHLSQMYTKSWTDRLAKNVANKELWSDVAKGISRTQRAIFVTQNLIRIGLSASSVFSAMYRLWMKKNRSWSDWCNLAVSCFFFANAIVKPITLQGVFESEQGKYMQKQFESKITSPEAKKEYEKAVKDAKTTEQKTYLTRNLEKIENLDEHFFRVHETGSVVVYSKDGLVINNVITISPEAYNQMGKEFLQRRLNEIKLLPTAEQRSEAVKQLAKDYNKPDFQDLAEKYVNDGLTQEQSDAFKQKMDEMPKHRKDQLFTNSAKYQNTENYRDNMGKLETEMSGGKNLEGWQQVKTDLESDLRNGKITQEQFQEQVADINKKIDEAKVIRSIRQTLDSAIDKGTSKDPNDILKDTEKKCGNGKTAEEWRKQEDKIQKQIDDIESGRTGNFENDEAKQRAIDAKRIKLDEASQQRQQAERFSTVFENAGGKFSNENFKNMIKESQGITRDMDTFTSSRNERFITNIQVDATKTGIEQSFGVTDYREARVGGQEIFKNLSIGDADRLYRKMNELPPDPAMKAKYIEMACKMVANPDCRLNGKSPRQFADVLEIVQQNVATQRSIENLPAEQLENERAFLDAALRGDGPAYASMRTETNRVYDAVAATLYQEHQVRMSTIETAVGHTMKHKIDWGRGTTESEYLTTCADEIFKENNIIGQTHAQDGQSTNVFYGAHLRGRFMFGIQVANGDSRTFSTIYSKGNLSTAPAQSQLSDQIAGQTSWWNYFFS